MTLPNKLTLTRIGLTIIFIWLILQSGLWAKLFAAIVFWAASLTDYFDGYYAKKYNIVTNFGKLMDPIADKFLILAAFFIFTQMHLVAVWMFVIICVREVVITVMRLWAMRKGKIMAAEKGGKYKTVFQIVALSFILLYLVFREISLPLPFEWERDIVITWHLAIYLLVLIAVVLTLTSGIDYLRNSRHV